MAQIPTAQLMVLQVERSNSHMQKMNYLRENLSFDQARMVVESEGENGKNLYMKGICIQGGIKNANQRV